MEEQTLTHRTLPITARGPLNIRQGEVKISTPLIWGEVLLHKEMNLGKKEMFHFSA